MALKPSRGMLKAETYIAGHSVRVVIVTAKLSLVSDIGRNCWGPLGPDTRIDDGTVMTFVRARKCRLRTREFRESGPLSAGRYINIRVPRQQLGTELSRRSQHAKCKRPGILNLFSTNPANQNGFARGLANLAR